MNAQSPSSEQDNANRLRETLRRIRAELNRAPVATGVLQGYTPSAPAEATPPPEDPVERLRRLIEERRQKMATDVPKPVTAPPATPTTAPSPTTDPAERLRQLLEERQNGSPGAPPSPTPAKPSASPPPPRPGAPPSDPNMDPAERLRQLVAERKKQLDEKRQADMQKAFGSAPPPPSSAPAAPAQPAPAPAPAGGEESPADRLRRLLEQQKNAAPKPNESPAEQLARALEERRRSNQLPPGVNPPPPPSAAPTGSYTPPPFGGPPQPRPYLPAPEERKPPKPAPKPANPFAATWKRIEKTPLGRTLKALAEFYIKAAGVAAWTLVFSLIAWVAVYLTMGGFNIFSALHWEMVNVSYQSGQPLPWPLVICGLILLAVWLGGSVLVWLKGRPYIIPVLLGMIQIALLPVGLGLLLLAGILMLLFKLKQWWANRPRPVATPERL